MGTTLLAEGVLGVDSGAYPTFQVAIKMLTIQGYSMADPIFDPAKSAAAIAFIQRGLHSGVLKPVVGHSFPLEEVAEAHGLVEANGHVGKVVLST